MPSIHNAFAAATLLAGCITATTAGAAGPGPYNTGVDDAGVPIASNAIDPHYTIVNNGYFGPAAYAKHDGDGPPVSAGTWLTDAQGNGSSWLVPSTDFFFGDIPGVTDGITYRTTFDLSAYSAPAWRIDGRWAADDSGLRIRLNGVVVPGVGIAQYDLWTSFTITEGFLPGVNVLEFDTYSTVNPTGLRVEMLTSAVPEPATWLMALAGAAALVLRRRGAVR